MTPKEKANSLVEKFYYACGFHTKSKDCALACVDEVINSQPTNLNDKYNDTVDYFGNNQTIIYWRKVKQEIEKL